MRYALTLILWLVIYVTLLPSVSAQTLININSANRGLLISDVPGVGAATADKIISRRNSVGAFQNIAEVCAQLGQYGFGVDTDTCKKIEAVIYFGQVSETSQTSDNTSPVTTSSGGINMTVATKEKKVVYPVTGLNITAPDIAHVNELVEFVVLPSDGRKNRLVRYSWNFGDGATSDSASPQHSYKYPGTYVVIVESYYLKEEKIARHEIEVLPVTVSVTAGAMGAITITNGGEEEINLHGMTVGGAGGFTFPKYSILIPGKSITVTSESDNGGGGLAVLHDRAGVLVATQQVITTKPTPTPTPTVAVATRSIPVNQAVKQGPVNEALEEIVSLGVSEAHASGDQVASASSAQTKDFWPYAGLLAIILFGLYSIYTNRSRVDFS